MSLALAFGMASQAQAQTVNPVQSSTYVLTPSPPNAITFGSHTDIDTDTGDGAVSTHNAHWSVTNKGEIDTSDHFGMELLAGGSIDNFGAIYGGDGGVLISSGAGAIINEYTGEIGGYGVGAQVNGSAFVYNDGYIDSEYNALQLGGGTVINDTDGYISGYRGHAIEMGSGTVNNYGVIYTADASPCGLSGAVKTRTSLVCGRPSALAGSVAPSIELVAGVMFDTSGAVFNSESGWIAGVIGAFSPTGSITVTNQGGFIGGYEYGIAYSGVGHVTNLYGGAIRSDGVGVAGFYEPAGSLNNLANGQGSIISGTDAGVAFALEFGPVTNIVTNAGEIEGGAGVAMAGGSITNSSTGLILGHTAVDFFVAPGTVTNAGEIDAFAPGDLAIEMSAGGTINNLKGGVIRGPIDASPPVGLAAGGGWRNVAAAGLSPSAPPAAITFNNAGLWHTDSESSFGGGVVNNTGVLEGRGSATLSNLAAFYNGSSTVAGVVDMRNGVTGNTVIVNAPFISSGHSVLGLDVFLGAGSQKDSLVLHGGSFGRTVIDIHDTNTGAGAANSGIVLVSGVTHATDFALDTHAANYDKAHGGIDHGLYLFTLQYSGGNEVLVGTGGDAAHQLATSQTAGQNIVASTSFGPSSGSSGSSAVAGFTGGGGGSLDRPRIWTAAVNTLTSDPTQQGAFGGRPGETPAMAAPEMRFSSAQSSSGFGTGYDQGLAMLKGGADLIRHDGAHSSFTAGVGAAYVQSDQRFTEGGTAMFYSGMVYGGYAAWRSGEGYVDASAKSAMLQARYQAPWLAQGRPGTGLNASSFELKGGWAHAFARGWSIEPMASAAVQKSAMDDLMVDGALVKFQSSYSGWANVGARLQGEGHAGGYKLTGELTARVWDRFGDDNRAYLADLGAQAPLMDRITGVSGEVSAELKVSKGQHLYGFVQSSTRAGAGQKSAAMLAGFALNW